MSHNGLDTRACQFLVDEWPAKLIRSLHNAETLTTFAADFLVCECPATHRYWGVDCALVRVLPRTLAVKSRGERSRAPIKRYACAQCGAVGAYLAINARGDAPPSMRPLLDARGRAVIRGETRLFTMAPWTE
jgi:hypothetical protein